MYLQAKFSTQNRKESVMIVRSDDNPTKLSNSDQVTLGLITGDP